MRNAYTRRPVDVDCCSVAGFRFENPEDCDRMDAPAPQPKGWIPPDAEVISPSVAACGADT